jgi:type II secretion system protein C
MRHPLWILNSTLLILLIIVLTYMVFSQQALPEREDIEPIPYTKSARAKVSEVNIRKIYEDDLFGTYFQDVTIREPQQDIPQLPTPPSPRIAQPLVWPKPQFLEPLSISLKGIIIIANDQTLNSAIIADKKTNRETTYHVGDSMDDAQLLKIFNNKVVFLRSNGQQEVIYLRENDAKLDPAYSLVEGWHDVIQKIGNYEYQISPHEFAKRVLNLAEFIDLLDITTVYNNGISIGLRIGRVPTMSLGQSLGLQPKDIIVAINDIPMDDTANRFEIYKEIIGASSNPVLVKLIRDNHELMITYKLEEFKKTSDTTQVSPNESSTVQKHPTDRQITLWKEHHEFAPTIDEIRRRDRTHMMQADPRSELEHSHFGG